MSPRFVLGRENVPCVAEVVNRSLKADCTDFIRFEPTDPSSVHQNVEKGIFNLSIKNQLINAKVVKYKKQ